MKNLWLLSGFLIFPCLALAGLIMSIFNVNPLFWLIIPSIIFEELFETHFYTFSNNIIANSLFILLFWFIIGTLIGLIVEKTVKSTA